MKTIGTGSAIIAFILLGILPVGAMAQTAEFNVSLGFGSPNAAEVIRLQNFLVTQGLLRVQPTGQYLSLTKGAVIAFQASQGIMQTGYFGPLTRAAAMRVAVAHAAPATVTVQAVSQPRGFASVALANAKVITWQTSRYPSTTGVNINLIKKVSDSPAAYTLVRVIAQNTPNDSQETWIPGRGENADDLYIEVTCSGTYQFTEGCQLGSTPLRAD